MMRVETVESRAGGGGQQQLRAREEKKNGVADEHKKRSVVVREKWKMGDDYDDEDNHIKKLGCLSLLFSSLAPCLPVKSCPAELIIFLI